MDILFLNILIINKTWNHMEIEFLSFLWIKTMSLVLRMKKQSGFYLGLRDGKGIALLRRHHVKY